MVLVRLLVVVLLSTPLFIAQGFKPGPAPQQRLRVLVVDGQNNHDYLATSDSLTRSLKASGRFEVSLSRTPKRKAKPEAWAAWKPQFAKYQAVVLDYNGEPWPKERREEFVHYVRNGGGVVVVHAANNPFPGWKEYEEMVALLWRPAKAGKRVTIDDATGRCLCHPAGEGPGAGHGVQHPFAIRVRQPAHPVMQGLPELWLHAKDELYHGQRGPALRMKVLESAFSDPRGRGTGAHEPISWIVPYGKGRVFTTVLGHHWWKQKDFDALHCVGFQTVLCRATEWVATRKVSLGVPSNFPSAKATSIAKPEDVAWPKR